MNTITFSFITSFTYYTGLGTYSACMLWLDVSWVLDLTDIQASSHTLHCDIFHFDIISSLFPASHITTCDICSLSFPFLIDYSTLSLFHIEWWFFTSHCMEDCHILSYHSPPMDSGSEMLFWEVVLLVSIHVTSVCGKGLIIWVCIFIWGHSLLIKVCAKKK